MYCKRCTKPKPFCECRNRIRFSRELNKALPPRSWFVDDKPEKPQKEWNKPQ